MRTMIVIVTMMQKSMLTNRLLYAAMHQEVVPLLKKRNSK
jgi:hypothetical protein